MTNRILISRNTAPIKLTTGKAHKMQAYKEQAYQVVDLDAPAGNAPADPAKLEKVGGDLVVRYPDGTQFTLSDFFTVCPGNACTVTLADGTATGQIVNAGAIAAADAGGLGFWGWTAIVGGGLGLAAAGGGGGGGAAVNPAPTLTGSNPTNTASAVLVDRNIVLTFSEDVVAGTGNIVISSGSDIRSIVVTDTTQVTFSGNTVTINPAANLQKSSTYTVTMAAGVIKDAGGEPFAGLSGSTLAFQTEDPTGPTLDSSAPGDNATGVLINRNVVLTFSKDVAPGTGNIVIVNNDNAADNRTIDVHDASQVTISGRVVTVNPTLNLLSDSHYSVLIADGVLQDTLDNPFDGILTLTELDFFTQDLTAPLLIGSTPADNATAVALGSNIVLTFNEVVQAGNGTLTLVNRKNAADTRIIGISDATQITFSGNTVTINPTADLLLDGHYNVHMNSGVIRDGAGNSFGTLNATNAPNIFTPDNVAPVLVSSTPVDDGVLIGNTVVLTFDEFVKAGSGNIVISNGSDTRNISVTNASLVTFSGNSVTITLAAALQPNSRYNLQMASGVIQDISGNAFAGISNSTTLDFDAQDTLAPTLVISTPADNASGVLVGVNLVLTFNEAVQAGSGNIVISNGTDTRTINVTDTSQVTFSGSTVTINPAADLQSNSTYNVQMASGVIRDAAGNAFAGINNSTVLDFQTQDLNAPTLVSSTPADNASGVLVGSNLVLTFNEAVLAGSGNIVISNGTDTRTISVTDTSQVTFSGSTVTINPAADLQSNSTYHVQMASGVIRDAAGNAFAGINSSTELDFATQDTLAPTLLNSAPADNATAVFVSANIVLTFNEAVQAGSGNIVISNGTDTRTISVTDTSQVTFSGSTLTINPSADLQNNSTYSVQMASGVIRDAAGNAFAGISSSTALDFQTEDLSAPLLISSSPADNASGVALGGNITLNFSKSVVAGSGSIVISNGTDTRTINVMDTSQVTFSGNTVTINPAVDLQSNSTYNVQMASGVIKDTLGNNFAGISSTALDFQTQDPNAPALVGSTPSDNASGVLVGANIVLTFSETVQAGSGNIVISNGTDTRTISVTDTSQVTFSGGTVTVNPSADLQGNSTYHVQMASGVIRDMSGNPFAGISSSTVLDFQTQDLVAPVLASSTPADNASGVLVGSNLVLTFNEAVQAGSGNIVISNGTDTRTINVTDTSRVTFSGSTVTVNPSTDLQSNSTYHVQMASGVIRDLAGNAYAGLTTATALDFQTQDLIAPTLVSSTPADNAMAVAVSSNIVLTFSEAVQAGSGNIVISNGTDTRAISVTDDNGQVTISGNTVTINPTTDLQPGSNYHLLLASGVIRDLAGNAYVGLTTATALDFETVVPAIELSAIAAGVGGFVINGQASDYSGTRVSSAGDVNGDGLVDLIVGAIGSDPAAGTDAGRSYVVFGKTEVIAVNLSAVAAGLGGFVINGQAASDFSGGAVSSAGDVNGDGLADLIVGVEFSDPAAGDSAGRSYVVFGKTGTTAVDLSAVSAGVGGFVINGQAASDFSGGAVSSAGDVNGDGLADLIVGAPLSDPATGTDAGRSYVVFGKTGTTAVDLSAVSVGVGGFVINGQAASDFSGGGVSSAGDVNGDGLADLIVGVPVSDPAAGTDAGRSYVVFGKTGTTTVDLSAVAAGLGGFVINGQCADYRSGWSFSSAGDVNGDGLADLIVGALRDPNAGPNGGRSYVVFGQTGTSAVDLSAVAVGAGGFVINGLAATDFRVHDLSVSSAGDVNGDGLADLIVGTPYFNFATIGEAGRTYIIFGSTTGAFAQTAVDLYGATGNDNFSDGGISQTLVTGQGNDTLTATAASVLYGGAGNDLFVIGSAMITALQNPFGSGGNTTRLARIEGGTGIDTLALSGGGRTLDLTLIANQAASNPDGGSRIDSIERIDLTGTGNNTLILAPNDVRDMAGMNLFNDGNGWSGLGATVQRHQLVIDGNAGDAVTATGGWLDAGTVSSGGQTYRIYNHGSSASQLLVNANLIAGSSVDLAPTLVSSTPLDNATGVAAGENIVLTFSEAVQAGSGNIVISNGTDTRTINVTDTSQVTFSGSTVMVNPTSDLQLGSRYHVQMASGVIGDLAGNAYEGLTTATALDFVTVVPAIELSAVATGVGGFVINGQSALDVAGFSISGASDVNGDGLSDFIVGAPNGDPAAGSNAGRSYVVFGQAQTQAIDLSSVAQGVGGFLINGQSAGNQSGWSVSSAGDVNGDGLADLIVGAKNSSPLAGAGAGRSYVVFGQAATSAIDLSAVAAGVGGFVINGEAANDYSGYSVSSVGDMNGDGLADLIVGAHNSDLPAGDSGRSYVVFGKSTGSAVDLSAVAAATGGFVINGQSAGDLSGFVVSGAGDVNGDGLADAIVGATRSDPDGLSNAGRSYVVFGKSTTTAMDLSAVAEGSGGFVINGRSVADGSGISVSGAGDVNGDGLADLIVGDEIGRGSYVVFGKSTTSVVALTAVAAGDGGFSINRHSGGDLYARSVSGAGDVNGDGLADLIVGASLSDPSAGDNAGRSYLVFGKSTTSVINLSLIAAGAGGGFVINGQSAGDESGWCVSSAGDVNGDGLADLLVGAYSAELVAGADAGRSYVIFGSTSGAFVETSVDHFGTEAIDAFSDNGTAQTLVTGAGNDTLTATAASILYAGAGNDTLNISTAMITALQSAMGAGGNTTRLARIDGGTGIDTLALSGSGLTLDLTLIANQAASNPDGGSRIDSIERIDLTGSGNNTVKLQLRDVLDMGSANTFVSNTRQQLLVTGNSGDTLDFADAAGTTNWTQSGTASIDSVTYNIWNHNTSAATVYVNTALTVI